MLEPRSILRCGAIRFGAVGREPVRFGAGRPVDGGRGLTWDARWRRFVIELHCRTTRGIDSLDATLPPKAPRCTLAR
jgi:hypothetical protein